MSSFKVDGLTVRVVGSGAESTEASFALASELARSRRVIDEQRTQNTRLAEELAEARAKIPPYRGTKLLGVGCVRFQRGVPYLMSRRSTGWASFAVPCADWDDLFRRYDVRVTNHGQDKHGLWWEVESICESAEMSR
jgi:hypothetical protein